MPLFLLPAHRLVFLRCLKYLFAVLFFLISFGAMAQTVVRDAETEKFLLSELRSIFRAAGLSPENARLVLIADDSINAFVAGGQTVFVHTGLITRAKTPADIAFVLAHETGHIVAGHVVQGILEQKKLQTASLISGLIGTAAGIVAGRPDAGIAVLMGTGGSGAGAFAAYRQTQESTADRIAVDILKKTGHSTAGFKNIMSAIQADERLNGVEIPAYFQTHPLTQTRLNDLARFWEQAPNPQRNPAFDKIKAKLIGFLAPPAQIKSLYAGGDTPALYARSIGLFRAHDIDGALKSVDQLIAREPDNPWFYELKGQFLFESGHIIAAISAYDKALQYAPNEPLIQLAAAAARLETGHKADLKTARDLLTAVTRAEPDNGTAWLMTATVYDRLKQPDLKAYAMARFQTARGQPDAARHWARKALQGDFETRYPVLARQLTDILDEKKSHETHI